MKSLVVGGFPEGPSDSFCSVKVTSVVVKSLVKRGLPVIFKFCVNSGPVFGSFVVIATVEKSGVSFNGLDHTN